jgi:hypothetical protein
LRLGDELRLRRELGREFRRELRSVLRLRDAKGRKGWTVNAATATANSATKTGRESGCSRLSPTSAP